MRLGKRLAARSLLVAILLGLAYVLVREWSTNDSPFYEDVLALGMGVALALVALTLLEWAMRHKDDPR